MFGFHAEFSGSLTELYSRSISAQAQSVQFFLGNPKSFSRSKLSSSDIDKAMKMNSSLNVFTHFPYVANLAGSKEILAWNGDATQDKKTRALLTNLQYELNTIAKLKTDTNRIGVVIHPGNYVNEQLGLLNIAKSINMINFDENAILILENSAGGGTSLATTFKQIKTIIDAIHDNKRKHVRVCVDTAHIYGYGDYNLSKIEEVDRMFKDFDDIIGIEYFHLLHLNDSEVKLKTRKDRHACLGQGFIWSDSFDSLIHLIEKCKMYNIPIILETHSSDMEVLLRLG